MTDSFNILVVCVGNICRSPLAERLLQARFVDLLGGNSSVAVSSAGVRALAGSPMDASAATELRRLGGDPDGFVARQLHGSMTAEADLVLTATKALRSRVLEEEPRALRRTFTIRELAVLAQVLPSLESPRAFVAHAANHRSAAAVEDYDVPDPYRSPAAVHREVADLLAAATSDIATVIAGSVSARALGLAAS